MRSAPSIGAALACLPAGPPACRLYTLPFFYLALLNFNLAPFPSFLFSPAANANNNHYSKPNLSLSLSLSLSRLEAASNSPLPLLLQPAWPAGSSSPACPAPSFSPSVCPLLSLSLSSSVSSSPPPLFLACLPHRLSRSERSWPSLPLFEAGRPACFAAARPSVRLSLGWEIELRTAIGSSTEAAKEEEREREGESEAIGSGGGGQSERRAD